MVRIETIKAREVLDSRGNPTVEVEIVSEAGYGRAIVPSGASTGEHEACELRDGDAHRFLGKGVLKAVTHVNEILAPALIGTDVRDQEAIDRTMIQLDGTENKSNLGANAILAVSMAAARTAANGNKMDLWEYLNPKASMMPMPMINVINGGAHANSSVDFQEFMLVPNGAHHFREAIQMSTEVFHHLKKFLKNNGHITEVGDEGGFAPNFKTNKEPLYAMEHAIKEAGYRLGQDFLFALDPATSELYNSSSYEFPRSGELRRSSEDMIQLWTEWCDEFPIISIEDGLAENDWDGWKKLVHQLGDRVQLVGDDLLVTNSQFLKRAIDEKAANAILIKVNQIGTLTEAHEAVKLAQKHGFRTVMSHRSGETEDTTIADLAVAWNCGQIKTGSMSRTDRIAKYNQLMRIADKLGDSGSLFHFES